MMQARVLIWTQRITRASTCDGLVLRSGNQLFNHDVHTVSSKGHSINCESTDINGNTIAKGVVEAQAFEPTRKNDSDAKSPRERCKLSVSDCNTPVDLATPIDEASPICMGDEYLKHSYRKKLSKLSLTKEINCLSSTAQEHTSQMEGLRRMRDLASVKVFFSHHLDGDIIKQQKKGIRVLITPNTQPGKEILASLVKAVQGLVGVGVYRSELLLDGIVTQKLEYRRHRMFARHVKRTRATMRLIKEGEHYRPVA
ncbi:hypothetical protein LguiA_031154 [Lonicera macranthoides]